MICEYYGKKCLYTPVALSLSCENCVVKLAYKNGVIKGREDLKQPHGEWIYKKFDEKTGISDSYFCSHCGFPLTGIYKLYCSVCGADMRNISRKEAKNVPG